MHMAKRTLDQRIVAVELSARFANIGEDPMISLVRAELFLDFIESGRPLTQWHFGCEPVPRVLPEARQEGSRPRGRSRSLKPDRSET
jgi:hypothetical protein